MQDVSSANSSKFRNLLTVKYFKYPVTQTKVRWIDFAPSHMTTPNTPHTFNRLSRPLLLGLLAGIAGIAIGIVPDFSAAQSGLAVSISARADEFSDPDLRDYAAALMEIEPIRQSTLAQVRASTGGTLPSLVCNQPSTMEGLNPEAKSLFVNYCNKCETIASSRGLSIERFNQITQSVRANPQLQNRVRSFMR